MQSPSGRPLAYDSFDGDSIILRHSVALSPTVSAQPAGVPRSAVLSENGIWVDCQPGRTRGDYACSEYLGANGRKVSEGTYRWRDVGAPLASKIRPKLATSSRIHLREGGVLERLPD